MRRIVKALIAVLALALAIPGAALAHGHRGHHGKHHTRGARRHHHRHHHRAKGARVLHFRPTASVMAEGEGEGEGEEGTGSEEAPEAPEAAGVVVSFEGEVLAIELKDGTVVKGKVTEDTRLLCMSTEAAEGEEGGEEDHGSGDDQESGDRSEGDSQEGAEGEEEGTSESGDSSGSPSAHDSSFAGTSEDGWSGGSAVQPCETTALTPGATVRDAELRLGSSGAVWEKVVLLQ